MFEVLEVMMRLADEEGRLDAIAARCSRRGNVLSRAKQEEQVIALGRLGWPLRRIEKATGVRRETAGDYLRAAGIVVRARGS